MATSGVSSSIRRFPWRGALLFLVTLSVAPLIEAQKNDAPVEIRAVFAPEAVTGSDGRVHLAYELELTNVYRSTGPLRLTSLDVLGVDASSPLAHYSGESLGQLVQHSEDTKISENIELARGGHRILFVWLTMSAGMQAPRTLRHRMEFLGEKGDRHTVDGVPVNVSERKPLVLGPPLRGLWLANEGPGNAQSHHWGSPVAVNGVLTAPQRFAIDFIGLDSNGHALRIPIEKARTAINEDFFGFGADVLAVAEGTVRDSRDGVADNKLFAATEEPAELTLRGLCGNFVVLEVAPGSYAHYCHLRQGSLLVHTGERVRRGQVIAHLGDTGNSSAPHLHFHLSNAPTFEESEGLPFTFSLFELLGKSDQSTALNRDSQAPFTGSGPTRHPREMPLDSDVVRFAP